MNANAQWEFTLAMAERMAVVTQVCVGVGEGAVEAKPLISVGGSCLQFDFKADDLQADVCPSPTDCVQHRSRDIPILDWTGRSKHRSKKLLGNGGIASLPGVEGQLQAPPVADCAKIVSVALLGGDLVGQLQRSLALARLA